MKSQIDFAYREHVGTLMFGPMRFVECHSARMFGEARTLAVFEVRTDRETCRVEF
jgi:hypothetical protein